MRGPHYRVVPKPGATFDEHVQRYADTVQRMINLWEKELDWLLLGRIAHTGLDAFEDQRPFQATGEYGGLPRNQLSQDLMDKILDKTR